MEWTLLIAIVAAITLLITIFLFLKSRTEKVNEPIRNENQRAVNENIPRRAQVVRNQRARLRANVRHYDNLDNEEENIAADENIEPANRNNLDIPDLDKVGAKKRAKLEAKAERKVQREHEEQEREERKKRAELAEEERKKASEKEAEEEKKREEEERKAREEEEKREHEEYLKLKAAFQVEEEGFDENEVDDEKNLLEEFIKFIKDNKVVIIEDVATHFKLKTQAVIDRIQQLRADGRLSGVIDDRGKFIYISHEELKSIAQFIKNRGRVSIAELAENSNQLISLTPQVS